MTACISLPLLFLLAADPADLAPVEGEPDKLSIVESHRPSFDQPGAVTVVDSEDLSREAPAVLADVLRDQPGVFVQQTGPGQGTPIVRGLVGSAVLMTVDGVRVNNAFFRPAPNQYFALVDPYNVDRVEVLRGPAASLLGSDALGGAVRIRTPTPRFHGPRWQTRAAALAQSGSADLSWVSRLSLATGREGISASGGITFQRRGLLRAGGERAGRLPFTAFSSYAADGKLQLESGAHQSTFGVQYLIEPETPRHDELVAGHGQSMPSSQLFLFEPSSRLLVHGRHVYRTELRAARSLTGRLSFQRIQDDRRVRAFGAPVESRERNRGDSLGAGVEVFAPLASAVVLTYGAEVLHDIVHSSRNDLDVATGVVSTAQGRYPEQASMDSAGLFAAGEIRPHQRLLLTPGVRLSGFWLDVPRADMEAGASLQLADVTGEIGTSIGLLPGLNLAANIGRGVRAPNIFDLSALGNRPGNRFQVPNPRLGPESLLGMDLGVKVARDRISGELFGFRSRYRDKIESLATGEVTADGQEVVRSENVRQVDLLGVEGGLRVLATPQLELSTTVNYTRGEERAADGARRPADRIPPLSLRVAALWRHSPRSFLEGFARVSARQDRLGDGDLGDPRIDPTGTDGFRVLSLRAGLPLGPVDCQLSLDNLLDSRYREHGSGVDASGFNATVTLRLAI